MGRRSSPSSPPSARAQPRIGVGGKAGPGRLRATPGFRRTDADVSAADVTAADVSAADVTAAGSPPRCGVPCTPPPSAGCVSSP
eukprot:scaffold36544_cov83-Isochrysis_galbana.AAC.2